MHLGAALGTTGGASWLAKLNATGSGNRRARDPRVHLGAALGTTGGASWLAKLNATGSGNRRARDPPTRARRRRDRRRCGPGRATAAATRMSIDSAASSSTRARRRRDRRRCGPGRATAAATRMSIDSAASSWTRCHHHRQRRSQCRPARLRRRRRFDHRCRTHLPGPVATITAKGARNVALRDSAVAAGLITDAGHICSAAQRWHAPVRRPSMRPAAGHPGRQRSGLRCPRDRPRSDGTHLCAGHRCGPQQGTPVGSDQAFGVLEYRGCRLRVARQTQTPRGTETRTVGHAALTVPDFCIGAAVCAWLVRPKPREGRKHVR